MIESGSAQPNEKPAGSPPIGEPVFLVIGKLRRTHGLRGELTMEVITDFPERIHIGKMVYLGDERQPMKVRSRRWHGKLMLIAFGTIQSLEEAQGLRNQLVYVRADELPPLPEGEFYQHQLLGLRVMSDDGRFLGHLNKILETGANDVYLVRSEDGKEILLPAIDSVIMDIDLEVSEIRVHLIPGLLQE